MADENWWSSDKVADESWWSSDPVADDAKKELPAGVKESSVVGGRGGAEFAAADPRRNIARRGGSRSERARPYVAGGQAEEAMPDMMVEQEVIRDKPMAPGSSVLDRPRAGPETTADLEQMSKAPATLEREQTAAINEAKRQRFLQQSGDLKSFDEPGIINRFANSKLAKPLDQSVFGQVVEGAGDAVRGVVRAGEGLAGSAWSGIQAGAETVGAEGLADMAGQAGSAARNAKVQIGNAKDPNSLTQQVFESTFTSVPLMLALGGGNVGLAAMAGQAAANDYGEGRDRGLTHEQAASRAPWMGIAEAFGERFGLPQLGKLFQAAASKATNKEMGRVLADLLVKEQAGEQVTLALQNAYEATGQYGTKPNMTLEQYLNEAVDTAKVTLGQSLLTGGLAAGVKAVAPAAAPSYDTEALAKSKGFLSGASSIDVGQAPGTTFTPPDSPVAQAGITPVVAPAATAATPQVDPATGVTKPTAPPAPVMPTTKNGMPDFGAALNKADEELQAPAVDNQVDKTQPADPSVPATPGTDGSAPEPTTTWTGRRGDGYQSAADAEQALPGRERKNPDLDWRVSQRPDGRFVLEGYERTEPVQATTPQAQPAEASQAAPGQPAAPSQQPATQVASTQVPETPVPATAAPTASTAPTTEVSAPSAPVAQTMSKQDQVKVTALKKQMTTARETGDIEAYQAAKTRFDAIMSTSAKTAEETTNGQVAGAASSGVAAAPQLASATDGAGGAGVPGGQQLAEPGSAGGAAPVGSPAATATPEQIRSDLVGIQDARLKRSGGIEAVKLEVVDQKVAPEVAGLASALKAPLVFVRDKNRMATFNGVATGGRIYINIDGEDAAISVAVHEAIHTMPAGIKETLLQKVMATVTPEQKKKFLWKYQGYGELPAHKQDEELVAMIAQDDSKRPEFWEKLHEKLGDGDFANLTKHILATLDKLLAKIRRGDDTRFTSDLKAARDAITTAMAKTARGETYWNEDAGKADEARAQLDGAEAQELDIDPSELGFSERAKDFTDSRDRTEVSTTVPSAKKKGAIVNDAVEQKWVIDASDVKAVQTHADAVATAIKTYNAVKVDGRADAIEELHKVVVDNLVWLHNKMPEGVRSRAKLWYDGANKIANGWAKKFDFDQRQIAGVLAVLSPQKDWFMNVSLGERLITIFKNHQNEPWSPAMTEWVRSYVNAAKKVDDKAARQKVLDMAIRLEGKTLAEMNDKDAARFIRVFDETYFPRSYRVVTPEGGFGDYVTKGQVDTETENDEDVPPGSVAWGSYPTIEKGVSILRNGSRDNLFRSVSEALGGEHKVRNFYNNILSPNSADGHVTIDTHAVAAAFIKALSGAALEVMHNFGTTPKGLPGASANADTGASGMYGVFADAYREAAAKVGVLPREMQSITWEAIRSIFQPQFKTKHAKDIEAIWDRYKSGELTREQARDEAFQLGGGIKRMPWEGTPEGRMVEEDGTSFDGSIAAEPENRKTRTLEPNDAKDVIRVSLSASTTSIPGVAKLYERASKGDRLAHILLQDMAADSLNHLLGGTSARVKIDRATGLYGGYSEPSLGASISFTDEDRDVVLAALAKFADNFNQEQIHVRQKTKAKPGTVFEDGSYSTPVYSWKLESALSAKQIQKVIDKSGLYGLTFGDDFVEAYYVGDPANEQAINDFRRGAVRAGELLGEAVRGDEVGLARLWPYGKGDGVIPYERIAGDVRPGPAEESATAKRVAEYLNAGARVKTFDQAEITDAQRAKQAEIAGEYEARPDNDLANPRVRRAYQELGKEVVRQYNALPIKVEVLDGQGEPYKSSEEMRRDVLDNNHLFIFGTTPDTFGPAGVDFSKHPLLADSGLKDVNDHPLLLNDLLRAVHDYYAHTMSPVQFGPKGEEAAWKNHMSMTQSPWARWALTTETRGQNSWVNFRPGAKDIAVKDRPFARQKAVLLPINYTMVGDRAIDKTMKDFMAALPVPQRVGTKPTSEPDVMYSEQETPRWYSELSRKIAAGPGQAMPDQWRAYIKGLTSKGVKQEEIEWSGINEWLGMQTGKVSRDAVKAYLDANGVRVEETVLGDVDDSDMDAYQQEDNSWNIKRISDGAFIINIRGYKDDPEGAIEAAKRSQHGSLTKYGTYVLPGGTNYRELLLTLPEKSDGRKAAIAAAGDDLKRVNNDIFEILAGRVQIYGKEKDAEIERLEAKKRGIVSRMDELYAGKPENYQSNHWDQPNIIAHIRLNDRVDADGKKVLFVEELQSDFGQSFKKQRDAISKAVDADFTGIVERMKKAGVLTVECD